MKIVDKLLKDYKANSREIYLIFFSIKVFNEDKGLNSVINKELNVSTEPILGSLVKSNNFKSMDKYSMKNLVVADFSSSNNFTLNKLYTTVMIGVTFASFIFLTYGLSSSITTIS